MISLREKLLKKEAEHYLSESIKEWHPLKGSGSLNVSFFGTTISGLSFTAKYNIICRSTFQQRKIRQCIDKKADCIFPKLICSFVSYCLPFRNCFITEWIDGNPVDIHTLNNNSQCLFKCARIVSQKLKTIHAMDVSNRFTARSLNRDYISALMAIRFYKIDVPHLADFMSYIDDHITHISNTNKRFVHFDFHMGNIVEKDDDYGIIDLETICVSDPWRDLVYATEINFPEQYKFWFLFLMEYFDGVIPNEYFVRAKLYVIIYMLMLAKYNRNGNMQMYFNLVNKVYEDYNQLNSVVPNWFVETAKELSENSYEVNDALRDVDLNKSDFVLKMTLADEV